MIGAKEWILKTISHEETYKVPFHFDFAPPARVKLEKHYGPELIERDFDSPVRWMMPNTVKPIYATPDIYGKYLKDEFGVVWILSMYDRGTPIPVLNKPSLDEYTFPDPKAAYRFENLEKMCNQRNGFFRLILIGDLWERATFMRGMENILLDLVLNKKFFFRLLRGITDYMLETMQILNDRFDFECFFLSDDYGSQKSLLMSPDHWMSCIKPFLNEVIKTAKDFGKFMMLHSCGHIQPIVRDLIDMGLDILHPIQPEANDIFKLKREFGKYLTLNGGLRTQDLLPLGSRKDIVSEVKKLKNKMGKHGGYILEPGITIQGDVPIDNLITMVEEVREN